MKRRGFSWLGATLILAFLLVLAAVFLPLFPPREPVNYTMSCQSNLKQIGLGIKQYVQDYDEHFPHVVIGSRAFGWADAVQPYLSSTDFYQCPKETDVTGSNDPRAAGYTDYWFNRNLAGISEEQVPSESLTIMAGDGNDGNDLTTARYSLNHLPAAWLADPKSPAHRHLDGMNLLFADGHVKKCDPQKIAPTPANDAFSFALQ